MLSDEKPTKEKEEKRVSKKKVNENNKKLNETLREIRTREGIIGYILRSSQSASIDLNDPTKIIDYAVLSSTAIETAEDLSEAFELGGVQNILLEGKDAKILLLKLEDKRLSIFMERNVDHERIQRDLFNVTS
jgi:predicted regulator of Ras-like GTPase activity (Roadblock/LC7/MglB family)